MCTSQSFDTWFTSFCATLTKQGVVDKISKAFSKLENDQRRLEYVWNLPELQQHLQVQAQYTKKNNEDATKLRNSGNKAFQKKSYVAALSLYNSAVCFAECQSETLALAYGNRSAAFYHLNEFSKCLEDISQAFDCNYPEKLHFKLYERKGKCLTNLNQPEKAVKSFEKAKALLECAGLEKKKFEKWLSDINAAIDACSSNTENNTELVNGTSHKEPNSQILNGTSEENISGYQSQQSYGEPPVHSEGHNETFINLASYCDVAYTDECGRFITAKRDIHPGEVILIEKPYASVLLPEAYSTNCHHCFMHITAAVPCKKCATVRFCSLDCLSSAEQSYHKTECDYLDLLRNSSIGVFGLLALRAVTVSSVKEIVSFMEARATGHKNSDAKYAGCNSEGKYVHDNYDTIYSLVTHDKDRAVHDLFKRAVMASFLLKILEKSKFFLDEQTANNDIQIYTGGLLLSHLQSFPCNAHEISEMQLDRTSVATSRPAEIAGGIYATLSLFNHSCNPAVNRNFYGDTCVVRAIRTIRAGDEISDNYGAVNAVQTLKERQSKLKKQYYFDCRCQACEEDWPLYPDIAYQKPSWKCVNCKGLLGQSVAFIDCGQCGKTMDTSRHQLALKKSNVKFDKALQKLLNECAVESTLPIFLSHLTCMDKYIAQPWRPYNDCQEAIKQCFAIYGNCHQISHDVGETVG